MPTQQEIDTWFTLLDGLAEQANINLGLCITRGREHTLTDDSAALVAIASQLAYGNAVAAAEFYMRFATPPREKQPGDLP